jgi:hypothetical protein
MLYQVHMTSLDSVKRGSGPTIIGGSKPAQSAQPIASVPKQTQINTEVTRPVAPVIVSQPKTPEAKLPEVALIKSEIPAIVAKLPPVNELKLPPKPIAPLVQEQVVAQPSQPVVHNNEAAYISDKPHASLKSVVFGAREVFVKKQTENIPDVEPVTEPKEELVLPQPAAPAQAANIENNFPVLNPRESIVNEEVAKPVVTKKTHRIPVYFAIFALVGALGAVGATYFLTRSPSATTQASTSSSQSANSITATTYLAKNSLDPDKKEQAEFKKSDPIQVCINYESQPNTSVIEIKITREVDGGSQLEIISTRLNAVGTDTRCLPFTGVQAVAGKYTVTLGNAIDSASVFKKVAESKFVIIDATNSSSSSQSL